MDGAFRAPVEEVENVEEGAWRPLLSVVPDNRPRAAFFGAFFAGAFFAGTAWLVALDVCLLSC